MGVYFRSAEISHYGSDGRTDNEDRFVYCASVLRMHILSIRGAMHSEFLEHTRQAYHF